MKDTAATLLVGLILLIIAFFGGRHQGARVERVAWQAEKNEMQETQRKALVDEIATRVTLQTTYERKAREASATYESSLSTLDRERVTALADLRRAGGLRISRTACTDPAAAGGETAGTGGPDEGGAATIELPERTQEFLFALTRRADVMAEQLRALQGWVKSNGFYGEPEAP